MISHSNHASHKPVIWGATLIYTGHRIDVMISRRMRPPRTWQDVNPARVERLDCIAIERTKLARQERRRVKGDGGDL